MKDILVYFAQMMLCSGVLLLLYRVLLDGRAPLGICRAYIFFAMVAGMVIPALRIQVYAPEVIYYTPLPVFDLPVAEVARATPVNVPVLIYLIVTILAFGVMAFNIVKIFRYRHNARITRTDFYSIFESARVRSPFSFFRNIFICQGLSRRDLSQVLAHEISHIRHHHSSELLLAEVIKNLLWFNPFVWIMKRSLVEVQEYQADRDVLQLGYNVDNYRLLIFKQLFGCNPDMTSGLNHSLTKKRFIMMTKQIGGRFAWLKVTAVIPVVGVLMMFFSFTRHDTQYVVMTPQQTEPAAATNASVDKNGAIVVVGNDTLKRDLPSTTNKERVVYLLNGEVVKNIAKVDMNSLTAIDIKTDALTCKKYNATKVVLMTSKRLAKPVRQTGNITKGDPLIIVDRSRHVSPEEFNNIGVSNIASIEVIKDSVYAKAIYGQAGVNGVILVTTKLFKPDSAAVARPSKAQSEPTSDKTDPSIPGVIHVRGRSFDPKSPSEPGKEPMLIVDGKVTPFGDVNKIGPQNIHTISVLKDDAAKAEYGEKAAVNGVIKITTKQAAKALGLPENSNANNYNRMEEMVVIGYGQNDSAAKEDDDTPLLVADKMPRFGDGNIQAFRSWVMTKVRYPAEAIKNKIQGRVTARFVVEKDGTVSSVKIIIAPNQSLSDEVIRVLYNSPKWTPGEQKGKKVRVSYVLPVDFRLP